MLSLGCIIAQDLLHPWTHHFKSHIGRPPGIASKTGSKEGSHYSYHAGQDGQRCRKKSFSVRLEMGVTAYLLAYTGFLRFIELAIVNVRSCDINIQRDKLILLIPKSKTDQLRQGDELVISRTGNSTCLVAMLETYLARKGTQLSCHTCK